MTRPRPIPADRDALRRDPEGGAGAPASLPQRRLYHALCRRIAELMQAHGFEMESRETVDTRLRVGTGHCFLTPLSAQMAMACGSRLAAVPGRIAFDKLDQAQMNRFMDAVARLVLSELLPRMPRGEWVREIEQMLGASGMEDAG